METLHAGTEDYRLLFDVTPLPLLVYDLETLTILNVNQAALETYGYTRDEFLGLPLVTLLDGEELASNHAAALNLPPTEKIRGQHRRKNGESFAVETSDYPAQLGGRSARLKMVVDVTARVQREEQLEAHLQRYREMAEHANDAIYLRDLQGRLTWMNAAGRQFLGYSQEEIQHLEVSQLVLPEDLRHLEQMVKRRLAGEETKHTYEVQIVTKSGRVLPVEISSSLIYQDGQPIGVMGIARSLTERKQLEEQLRQAQKMEAVGRLAGGIAHDFNNRLTAIQGFTDLLLKRSNKDEQQHYYLEQIKQASERAAELTHQLLTFSHKQALHPKILNLNDVVSHGANLVRVLLGENIALHLILGADIGLVKVDPGQLEHVMMNLALNAGDAMPNGGNFTIETTDIEISELQAQFHPAIPPGEYVRLLIKDTGCGMSEATLTHLFEPFFTTKERGKGTGLGLFTAYGIIKQSGGFIEVKSVLGEGTTFQIYLPVIRKTIPINSLLEANDNASAATA
jgi:PAS domain S-box-containing protein